MRYVLDVFRGDSRGTGTRQRFAFETDDPSATVACALTQINQASPILDADGREAEPIQWECSCLQRRCGACAMLINGHPALACDAKLADLGTERVMLDPLAKFPLVADLVVDRSAIFDGLARAAAWLEEDAVLPDKRSRVAQEASRCLMCGCCLEVCPNFAVGGEFGGSAAAMAMTRLLAEAAPSERKRLSRAYGRSVYGGCAKSLACRSICPAGLDIDELVSRSNAAAIWGRF